MVYTQPPNLALAEIEALIQEAKTCRFASLNKDGTIHLVPIWCNYENGNVYIATPEASQKARNVKRNPNVTVLVESAGWPVRAAIIYGTAEIDDRDLSQWGAAWAEEHMSKERVEPYLKAISHITKWVKIIVKPVRFGSFDYAKDEIWDREVTQRTR